MIQLAIINPENVSKEEIATYPIREAVRTVVFDSNNCIALLHVTKESYYKIPGGGIEHGENQEKALARECMEEIGCEVEILKEIGSIIEYRRIFNLKQISYCYFAKLQGEKGKPQFTDDEIENGFEQIWLPYADALKLLSNNIATTIEGRDYIVPRDVTFLKAAKKLFTR